MTASTVKLELEAISDADKAISAARYFKTEPGGYGEGDIFRGITVPALRTVAKRHKNLPIDEIKVLLDSELHEDRLIALMILVMQYEAGDDPLREAIYHFYLANTKRANNWDLVDSSAEFIVGPFLETRDKSKLTELAASSNVWERRIAMIATFHYIRNGDHVEAFRIADLLIADKHDLIHKAVGWMLREVGKRCSEDTLRGYLNANAARLPRTALRYSIERFSPDERAYYMQIKRTL